MLNKGFSDNEYYDKSEIEQVLKEIQNKSIFPILEIEFLEINDTFFTLFDNFQNFNGKQILDILQILCELNEVIEKINLVVEEEEYKETKLFFCKLYLNEKLKFNKDQIEAIIREDKVLQIIAGAGTGKTTTLVAKVKYLVEIKNVPPSKILCLSFSKNCAQELRNEIYENNFSAKINKVQVSTFHQLGLKLIRNKNFFIKTLSNNDDENDYSAEKEIFKEFLIEKIRKKIEIFDYFKINFHYIFNLGFKREQIFKNNVKIKNKNSYDYDYATFRYRDAYDISERAKSFYDLRIADFLFSYGIEYELLNKKLLEENSDNNPLFQFDFYLKDYDIFIEYIRLNVDNKPYNLKDDEIKELYAQLETKRKFKEDFNKKVIFLDSSKGINNLLKNLSEELTNYVGPLKKKELSYDEAKSYLNKNFLKNMDKLDTYFIDFVKLFKEHDFKDKKISDFKGVSYREKFFLDIASKYYAFYQDKLSKNCVDFPDMIIKATKLLRDNDEKTLKDINYDYILVDEYQDISDIRFNFLDELKRKSGAKLVVVGDDWQSIYGFNGCQVKYFSNFKKDYFHNAYEVFLNRSYRYSENLKRISRYFISRDKNLIKKPELYSKKSIDQPLEFWNFRLKKISVLWYILF